MPFGTVLAFRRPMIRLLLLMTLLGSFFSRVSAAASPETEAPKDLTRSSAVPLASLFSLTFRDVWTPSRWNSSRAANTVDFRPLIPFKVWNQPNLTRITLPYRTEFDSGNGLGDVRIFDLVTFKTDRIFWGVGPAVNLRPDTPAGIDTFQSGLAAGAVVSAGRWSVGVLTQSLFSSQVAATTIQPILTYKISESWTVGQGELPFVFDWKRTRFIYTPLGIQLGYLAKISGQAIRFFVNPQYNARNIARSARWTLASGVTFLILPPQPGEGAT